ncbi:hypothetical protein Cenrod_1153 [Candidatus Symbiobacter mobilis CR]|uniref:Uncharacterized protein n=1 Tax=Candidatus Symbiobacter mobilis CR TaxID=946483 RepID=U5N6T0_9BURK|nr:hypothetical protein Cenrod_1153 [Candidatus Symbiobacter mobilis CR]
MGNLVGSQTSTRKQVRDRNETNAGYPATMPISFTLLLRLGLSYKEPIHHHGARMKQGGTQIVHEAHLLCCLRAGGALTAIFALLRCS